MGVHYRYPFRLAHKTTQKCRFLRGVHNERHPFKGRNTWNFDALSSASDNNFNLLFLVSRWDEMRKKEYLFLLKINSFPDKIDI
jgi:hypothetical protein